VLGLYIPYVLGFTSHTLETYIAFPYKQAEVRTRVARPCLLSCRPPDTRSCSEGRSFQAMGAHCTHLSQRQRACCFLDQVATRVLITLSSCASISSAGEGGTWRSCWPWLERRLRLVWKQQWRR